MALVDGGSYTEEVGLPERLPCQVIASWLIVLLTCLHYVYLTIDCPAPGVDQRLAAWHNREIM